MDDRGSGGGGAGGGAAGAGAGSRVWLLETGHACFLRRGPRGRPQGISRAKKRSVVAGLSTWPGAAGGGCFGCSGRRAWLGLLLGSGLERRAVPSTDTSASSTGALSAPPRNASPTPPRTDSGARRAFRLAPSDRHPRPRDGHGRLPLRASTRPAARRAPTVRLPTSRRDRPPRRARERVGGLLRARRCRL